MRVVESCQLSHGVALAGAEFGVEKASFSNAEPGLYGKDYVYSGERTVKYFAQQGIKMFRIPFRWERIQPALGGELNKDELARLKTVVQWAGANGCHVILDVHNYGRYRLYNPATKKVDECIIDHADDGKPKIVRKHFADLWKRLAAEFAGNPAVAAYGLMNEPHDMATADWKKISQAAVDAVRTVDRKKLILVCGDGWANAHRFGEVNGPDAWIEDPVKRTGYEAHCYLDSDFSGTYKLSYSEELARDPELASRPEKRLAPFIAWCQKNQVCGFVGEYGVPQSDARWVSLGKSMVGAMQESGLTSAYWAAGEWWGAYPLSVHPRENYAEPAPLQRALSDAAKGSSLGDFHGLNAPPSFPVGGLRTEFISRTDEQVPESPSEVAAWVSRKHAPR